MNAFITGVSSFLPGKPISNDEIDNCLGKAERQSAKTKRIILAKNGIKTRHYAIDPATGKQTFSNAALTAEAIKALLSQRKIAADEIECLCCGTSSPDQVMPGHASMVHGELAAAPCEVMTTAGICLTGVTALKYGAMSVASGVSNNAVATGSELASTFLCSPFFQKMSGRPAPEKVADHPAFSFEAEFLRWMLSDGAGAVLVEKKPDPEILNLRIEWIDILSQAHRLPTCMYAGATQQENGEITGWRQAAIGNGLEKQGIMTIKQNAALLNNEIINASVTEALPRIARKHHFTTESVDWFLPHISSEFFRQSLHARMQELGFAIPQERWFTNLASKGNTGSASFYIMLEELYTSGKLTKGQKILAMVPESGRFSVGWLLLTVT